MDTIIFLKIKKRAEEAEALPPVFHIRDVREDPHLIFVEIPRYMFPCRQKEGKFSDLPAKLASYLLPFLGYSTLIDTVMDRSLETFLERERLKEWWEHTWPYPQYRDYHRKEYAQHLIKKAMGGPSAVYVLGYEEFVPQVLAPYMKKIKSLHFLVDRSWKPLEDYLEDLYEEEGLAASCRVLDGKKLYRGLCFQSTEPCVILDLSGEERIMPWGGMPDITWIDMDAQEEKHRRLEAGGSQIRYFSMKEEWRSGCFTLDTAKKNRYNT